MPQTLYNSLTRKVEVLSPVKDGTVSMYVCGPTVYDDCHVGHFLGPVVFDALARWLSQNGLKVRFANNITDVDDKIIGRALKGGEDWKDVAGRYTQQYFDILKALRVMSVTHHPRCTEFISQMISYVQDLEKKGFAYRAHDGVYFEVSRLPEYGRLSGRKVEDMKSGARIERDESLRHPADFCLWKDAKPGEPFWDSPWGKGRPGWHLECSVMASCILGSDFDIHGGGDDLKFPHHENEIAQAAGHGDGYARMWLHNGMMEFEGAKISKSDPRNRDPEFAAQFKAKNVLTRYGGAVFRFFVLQGHYRRPFDFSPKQLDAARTALTRILRFLGPCAEEPAPPNLPDLRMRDLPEALDIARDKALAALEDDFNTGNFLAQLFIIMKTPGTQAPILVRDLGRLIGLFQPGDPADVENPKPFETPKHVAMQVEPISSQSSVGPVNVQTSDEIEPLMKLILELRKDAKTRKDFGTADRIRDALKALNIEVQDGKDGATWKRTRV